jgi:hypothetical protein
MKLAIALLIFIGPVIAFAQFGANFHQTNIPFVGINYEVKDRIRPEFRLGVDAYLEDLSAEFITTYDMLNKEDYELYGGVGVRGGEFTGLVIPIGLNVYPFSKKNFGFHLELAPIIGEDNILRGSWGIRYKFRKSE